MTVSAMLLMLMVSIEIGDSLHFPTVNAEIWQLMTSKPGIIGESAEYLLNSLPDDDILTITEETLSDHLYGADEVRSLWYDSIPDDIYMDYLLYCRFEDEPLVPWRTYLDPFWSRRLEECSSPSEAAEFIAVWINRCLEVTEVRAPLRDPWSTLYSGGGTKEELFILLGASLRSAGIPARKVVGYFSEFPFISNWYEVWTESGWYPLLSDSTPSVEHLCLATAGRDKADVTAGYTSTGVVKLIPAPDITGGPWNVLLKPAGNLFDDEFAISLNPFGEDSLIIGTGEYLVEISFIYSSQLSDCWVDTIKINACSTAVVHFSEALYSITPIPR